MIIAELSSSEALLISSQPTITVPEHVNLGTNQRQSGVAIAEQSSERPKAHSEDTALSNAMIYQCENAMDRIRADEVLRIELGNQMSSSETAINVSYAGLIDALKRTIFSQSKTFQSLGTTSATEVLTATTVIITPYTMECLILFMADMWEIKLGEKEIKKGSYLSRFIDKRAGVEREKGYVAIGARTSAFKTVRIDEDALEKFSGVESIPFTAGDNKKIAVKIIDNRGIESFVIKELE